MHVVVCSGNEAAVPVVMRALKLPMHNSSSLPTLLVLFYMLDCFKLIVTQMTLDHNKAFVHKQTTKAQQYIIYSQRLSKQPEQ